MQSGLNLQTFEEIVSNQSAAMQANSTSILDFSIGSVLLALIEANAGNSIWLQALATTILATTRLSTSSGIDVDTFIEDFGYERPEGNYSSGDVTLFRFTATQQGFCLVGSIFTVSTNNLSFIVTLDSSLDSYDPSINAYVADINVQDLTVPVICQTIGTIGNVVSGSIDTIQNPTACNFDLVTNEDNYNNGLNAWTDQQTKIGFQNYINSLSRATYLSIEYAVNAVQISTGEYVFRSNIVANFNEDGGSQPGYFYVVIDNGSGSEVSTALKTAVENTLNDYAGLTITYNVDKAGFIAIAITVTVNLISNPTETQTQITANITQALQAFALTIPFNSPFPYNKIAEIVYNSDTNIANIPSISGNNPVLNGGNSDVAGSNLDIFGIPTITVNYA